MLLWRASGKSTQCMTIVKIAINTLGLLWDKKNKCVIISAKDPFLSYSLILASNGLYGVEIAVVKMKNSRTKAILMKSLGSFNVKR